MKYKNALDKLKPLLLVYSFTSEEARRLGVSSANLAYYVKKNSLKRIGHGIYRSTRISIDEDFRWEDLIESMQRVKNSVICLTSALSLYNLTEEMPSQHWLAIRHDTIHRTILPIKVVRMRNLELGKTTIKIGKFVLPIFDRERTILDSFRYLGKETALKALKIALKKKGNEKIDIRKLRKYSEKLRVKIEPFLIVMTL